MIKVTIELFPFGVEKYKRKIGEIVITNDMTGTKTKGNYKVQVTQQSHGKTNNTKLWKTGTVNKFPRLRLGVYDLIFRALKDIVGARNDMP